MSIKIKKWKKVTPIPPELGKHGYLWDCPVCGKVKVSINERPITPCDKCGFYEERMTMTDLISRQAAIDAVRDECLYCEDYGNVRWVLGQLPPAQPDNDCEECAAATADVLGKLIAARRWIPLSTYEDYPEPEDMYKVPEHKYLCKLRGKNHYVVLARLRHLNSPMAAFWDWYGRNIPDEEVVAWMPIEPYEEESK